MNDSLKILVCAAGSRGDIHPLLGIGAELQSRGHEVKVLANPTHRVLAEKYGFGFVAVGDVEDMRALHSHPKSLNYNDGWKQWLTYCAVKPMRSLYHAVVKETVQNKTIVLANYLSFGARIAQDRTGVPLATVHMDAHTIRSRYDVLALPSPAFAGRFVPDWYHGIQFWLMDHFWIDPLVGREINKFRKELGLAKVVRVAHEWWHSPLMTIGLYPEWWSKRQSDWPSKCLHSDFIFWDDGHDEDLAANVQDFLDAGEPPIAFTPGMSAMHNSRYFAAAIATCQTLNQRGIIVTDRNDLVPPLPDTVQVFPYIPFGPLLPRVKMVVHHGGVGTSARCMRAGLPQVVIPTLYNQPDTAKRLVRLGIAKALDPSRVTAKTMTTAVSELLESPDVSARCRQVANQIDSHRGLQLTVELIESLQR